MSQRTFLISDTHFGHTNILTFKRTDGTPLRPFSSIEEHDETIVENWNKVVKPADKVYHLGDVSMNKEGTKILARCNGTKVLIRGNHDTYATKFYTQYFRDIYGVRALGDPKVILSHIPIHPTSLSRWKLNIHGHLHANLVLKHPAESMGLDDLLDTRYVCVSCEHINYTPILMEELLERNSYDKIE